MSERLVGSPGFPGDGSEERTPRDPPRRQPASVFPDLGSSPCVRDAACRPEQGPVRGPQVTATQRPGVGGGRGIRQRGSAQGPPSACSRDDCRARPRLAGGSLIPRRGQSRTAVGAARASSASTSSVVGAAAPALGRPLPVRAQRHRPHRHWPLKASRLQPQGPGKGFLSPSFIRRINSTTKITKCIILWRNLSGKWFYIDA